MPVQIVGSDQSHVTILEICHLVHLLCFLFWGYQDGVEAEPHLARLGIFDTDT